jgi:hypothetical protein
MKAKLVKTDLGRTEMRTRELGLPVLERRFLILADGTRTLAQLQEMFNFPVKELASKLQAMGLLVDASDSVRPIATVPQKARAEKADHTARAKASTQPAPLRYDAYEIGLDVDVDVDAEAALVEDLASDFAEERSSTWTNSEGHEIPSTGFGYDTAPGMLTHRAASASGLSAGRSYLIATCETQLGAKAPVLVRTLLAAQTEADLYFALEMLVTAISPTASASEVNGIIQRFEQKISLRWR